MAGPGHRSARKPLLVKIVMAGESCVGKTSIVRRYTEPSPAGPPRAASYIATVGIDFKVKTITFNDTTVKLQIWDTAGQEQFHTISTSYFRGARGFILVYDITNSDSFQGITSWMKDIHEKADDEVDIVLLGNKCDKETERVIPKHRGEKLAWEYGIPFFETSATDNINIEAAFSVLVKEILDKNSCVLCDLDVVDLNESKKKRTCCQL
ncbi:ras-related protein Rab-10-like isoform X1 [Mauremys reevesii]|uniref:ras-related protein Rab-10-like isoform X1 n=1 Tax=Mauremys reevesii TaxID=260615 RepID=UPI00193FA545|nr:ras-related protein Rab-10-like isoform X1 [Mauremys reevesii]